MRVRWATARSLDPSTLAYMDFPQSGSNRPRFIWATMVVALPGSGPGGIVALKEALGNIGVVASGPSDLLSRAHVGRPLPLHGSRHGHRDDQ